MELTDKRIAEATDAYFADAEWCREFNFKLAQMNATLDLIREVRPPALPEPAHTGGNE